MSSPQRRTAGKKTRLQWHVDVAFCYRAQARRFLAFAARRSSRSQGHRSLLRSSASLRAPAGGSVDHSAVRGSAALGKKTVLNDALHTCRTSCYANEHTHTHTYNTQTHTPNDRFVVTNTRNEYRDARHISVATSRQQRVPSRQPSVRPPH